MARLRGSRSFRWVPLGFLDVYYLSLEQRFRCAYNEFVSKLHDGSLDQTEVFRHQGSRRTRDLHVEERAINIGVAVLSGVGNRYRRGHDLRVMPKRARMIEKSPVAAG